MPSWRLLAPLFALLLAGCGGTSATFSGKTYDQVWDAAYAVVDEEIVNWRNEAPYGKIPPLADKSAGVISQKNDRFDDSCHSLILRLGRVGEGVQVSVQASGYPDRSCGGLTFQCCCAMQVPQPFMYLKWEKSVLDKIRQRLDVPSALLPDPPHFPDLKGR